MASFLGPIGQLIHGTATTLIDSQITSRLATTVGELVTTGFKVVEEVLKVAQDLTAPDDQQSNEGNQP